MTYSDNNFVVYAYVRKGPDRFGRIGTYYYIGKGRPNRPYMCGKGNRVVKCPKDKKNNILILHSNLSEKTAFEYEKKLIAFYGRIGTCPEWGILRNMTDGGEGCSGLVHSESTKKKMSEDRKGEKNSFFNKKHSEKVKSKRRVYFNLYHPDYGEFKNTYFDEMRKKFPGIFINRSKVLDLARGRINSYKGWILLKNKNALLLAKKENPLKNYFTWVHKEYGTYRNISVPDLCDKFPELKLVKSSLYLVSNKKQKSHKGWTIVESPDSTQRGKRGKTYNWNHATYGSYTLSISSLIRKFKDQNLQPSCLSMVVNKKANHHKGWRVL